MSGGSMELFALQGIPLVAPGDDLAGLIIDGYGATGRSPENDDVIVIAQKIVSKAEGRHADLRDVTPSARARELAGECDKDPRLVELILAESTEVLRWRPGLLIVVHRLGMVLANAGIDHSNVGLGNDDQQVLLLPLDPDATCRQLREELATRAGARMAVIINDSVGRAWRGGTVGITLGAAGVPVLDDLRGRNDLDGRPLEVSIQAVADELAAAASLLQGQADEGWPVVVIRGFTSAAPEAPASALVRPKDEDLFR
ncbi:MAG: coenzyme F420-0:L-glutamate ligase [Alphaproteobacteria bacterium]|jgi:coenzyme F420-0:L-glutamate ligase/coenzyme F420-1:gamma-L-glutamate ligase